MKKRIAIDMDEVIADVVPKFIDIFEDHYGWRPKKEDYYGKKLYHMPEALALRNVLFEKGFFRDLPVMPGAQETLRELMDSYEIYIVTAAMEFRNSFEDKYDWLLEHFPFLDWKKFVFCGYKHIIRADYLIDDHPHNLETFEGKPLIFTASHNINEDRFERLNNWEEARQFFIQEAIQK
jgi:5'-nucleotidase